MAAKKLAYGRLVQQIRFEEPTTDIDGNGAQIPTWALYYECRTDARPLTADERFRNQLISSQTTEHFRIRYNTQAAAITPRMRIVMGSRIFDIEGPAINPGNRNKWLIFKGVEKNV